MIDSFRKICILSDDFPTKDRQVFIFVEQLVIALADFGLNISVIAPQSITRSIVRRIPLMQLREHVITTKGNHFTVYRPYSFSAGNNRLVSSLFSFYNNKRIDNILRKVKPDILYGHFWHSANKLKDYALETNKPLFVACGEGDDALENLVDSLKDSEKSKLVKAVKGVISVSSENKRKSISLSLCKDNDIIVLPNCVDVDTFHPMKSDSLKKQLGITEEDFTIAFTGAFIKRKGCKKLAEAIDKLNDDNIKVIFIGKGLDGDDCTPNCKGIVHIGPVNHDLIPQYLNASDVFALPTLKEGCSNAIVEALACGLPIISSNRSFNDDILNENNSIRIDPENVDSIADAIYNLKNDKNLYQRLKTYCSFHSSNYSIDMRAKNIVEFIKTKL